MRNGITAPQQARRVMHRISRALPLEAALLATFPAVYLGVSAYVADRMSRPVRFALTSTPAQYGLEYEDVNFASTVDHVPLSGWYIGSGGGRVIVMMHGRNGRRDGGDALEIASKIAAYGYDVFMFDFRAHGTSGGDRYSMGKLEVRDVEGALNYLEAKGVTAIGAHATSMGGSPMVYAAVDHPEMKALVTDSSFAYLAPILEKQFSRATGLPALFNPGVFLMGKLMFGIDLKANMPAEAVSRLGDRPLLIIHSIGDDDEDLIPTGHARDLARAGANNPNLQLWLAPGKGHCRAYANNKDEYMARLLAFYDTNLR